MTGILGGIVRVVVRLLVAALLAFLLPLATDLGVPLTEEQVAEITSGLDIVATFLVTLAGYFLAKYAGRFVKAYDPPGWADRVWKEHAGTVIKPLHKEQARHLIERGGV